MFFSVSIIVSLICLVGLWLLKRWSVYAYAAILVCNQLALVGMGLWGIGRVIIPMVIIGLLAKCMDKVA